MLAPASCVNADSLPRDWQPINVRLGENRTKPAPGCITSASLKNNCPYEFLAFGIEEIILDYKSTDESIMDGIALLRLSRDVEFTKSIKPICLPINSSIEQTLYTVVWSKAELRSGLDNDAEVQLSNKNTCVASYAGTGAALGDDHVCVGKQNVTGECKTNIGIPLMNVETMEDYERWTVVGIMSFNSKRCKGWANVYTRVYDYLPWIHSRVRP